MRCSQRVLLRLRAGELFTSRCSSIALAINCRSCGEVRTGVWVFSPPRLLVEKPRGEECQGLVMMPGYPVPHLIIRQANFPLGSFETFFDAMRRLGDSSQLAQRHLGIGVRQIIIMLVRSIRLMLPRNEQKLVRSGPASRRPRLHSTLHNVH